MYIYILGLLMLHNH